MAMKIATVYPLWLQQTFCCLRTKTKTGLSC